MVVARKQVAPRGLTARRNPDVVKRYGVTALSQVQNQAAIDPSLAATHTPLLDLDLIQKVLQFPPIFLVANAISETKIQLTNHNGRHIFYLQELGAHAIFPLSSSLSKRSYPESLSFPRFLINDLKHLHRLVPAGTKVIG